MVKVRRGNVALRVPEDAVNSYLQQGFDAYDENGHIVKRAVVKDALVLQAELAKADKTIEWLRARVAELEAQLAEARYSSIVSEASVKPAEKTSSNRSARKKKAE